MITINNRDTITWQENLTVRGILQIMKYNYQMITVTVNDELIAEEEYDSYRIPDNAKVTIFHLAHGG